MKLGKKYEFLLLVLYPKSMIGFQKTSICPDGSLWLLKTSNWRNTFDDDGPGKWRRAWLRYRNTIATIYPNIKCSNVLFLSKWSE